MNDDNSETNQTYSGNAQIPKSLLPVQQKIGEPVRPDIPIEPIEDKIIKDDIDTLDIVNDVEKIVIDESKKKENEVKKIKAVFDKKTLNEIRSETEKELSKIFKGRNVQVKLTSHKRDLEQQAKHYMSGASKTPVSLHNFGLAGDFAIFIDGKQVTGNGKKGIHGSKKPYQVLGHFAKKKGFFWGWKWDSGHVGKTRFVTEALKQNPELAANSDSLKNLYDEMIKKDELPSNLKGLVSKLGKIYGKEYTGKFTGKDSVLEKLLEPINPSEY